MKISSLQQVKLLTSGTQAFANELGLVASENSHVRSIVISKAHIHTKNKKKIKI